MGAPGERREQASDDESAHADHALSARGLEALARSIDDAVIELDARDCVAAMNDVALRLFGYSASELLGRPVSTLFDAGFGAASVAGEPHTARYTKKSGETFWGETRTEPIGAGAESSTLLRICDVSGKRAHEDRMRVLGAVTAALVASLDPNHILHDVAALTVPALADWCAIDLVDADGQVYRAGVAHPNEALRTMAKSWWQMFPADQDKHWLRELVRTRVGYGLVRYDDAAFGAMSPALAKVLRELRVRETITVAIGTRERAFGALTMVMAESGRVFAPMDAEVCTELGTRIGVALENALLFSAERAARNQLSLLARAGEAFAASLDYEATLKTVVEVALPTLGDFGFFDIVEGDHVRRTAAAHEDPETLALLNATRWSRSERTDKNLCALSSGRSGIEPVIDDAWMTDVALSPEHLALLRALSLCSLITVPLRIQGELIGSLTLCFGRSKRHHSADDLRLAEELARRASAAITQARLFRQAQLAAARAEEAARIKDEFLATVSHELRTPLNAIYGWATLLRNDASLGEQARKGIDVIRRNAQAQTRIIEDILDVSRIITGKLKIDPKPIDMVTLARQAVEVVEPSATAKGIAIDAALPTHPVLLVADPDRLRQAVWNLLSNAVKFTPHGGAVSLVLEQEGPMVTLRVRDSGEGIAPAFLPHVFERFRQADSSASRRYGGLGLGLAIVRHVVELHGGTVSAASEGEGRGATFTMKLPVRAIAPAPSSNEAGARPTDTPHALPAALGGVHVLVVDDDPDARELASLVLSHAGASVITAGDAAEAMEMLQRVPTDVLVSDIGMPREDGFSLIRRIRSSENQQLAAIPAIALSAYARAEDRRSALLAGFTRHMAKPVDARALVEAIRDLLPSDRP